MKNICIPFLLLFYTLAWSVDSQVVIEKSAAQQTDVTPQMINGRYVYVLQDGDTQRLMAHNGLTGSNETTLILSPGDEITKLSRVAGDLVIVKNTTGTTELWKTQGTASSTSMIPVSDDVQVANTAKQWMVHADWDQNKVYRSNGSTVQVFDVNGPYGNEYCVFEDGKIILNSGTISQSVANDHQLLMISDASIDNITSILPAPENYGVHYTLRLKTLENMCFAGYQDENFVSKLGTISPNGQLLTYSDWPAVEFADGVYHNKNDGYFYFLHNNLSSSDPDLKIFQVDFFSRIVKNVYEKPNNSFFAFQVQFFGPYLAISYNTPTSSPDVSLMEYLDATMNLIAPPFGEAPLILEGYSQAAHWMGQNLIIHTTDFDAGPVLSTRMWKRETGQWIELLDLPGFIIEDIAFNEKSPQGFIEGLLPSTGMYQTHRLFQAPKISKNTAGAWFSADHLRQGININHGKRGDGSEYLFITVYTFDNGAPLWMAGVAELADDISSVTIPVYQYQGLNWWQAGVEPSEGPSGTLTISHSSCDQISVSMTLGGDNQTIEMERMVNTDSQAQCQD